MNDDGKNETHYRCCKHRQLCAAGVCNAASVRSQHGEPCGHDDCQGSWPTPPVASSPVGGEQHG